MQRSNIPIRNYLIRLGPRCLSLIVAALIFIACAKAPVVNENVKVGVVTPPTITPEPMVVNKPVNVSFSTLSKERPVDWQWIDPEEKTIATSHDVKKGVLRMRVPTKKTLNLESQSAPRYIKPIKGDFQIETRVSFLPKENYQGAGLLIYKDDKNFIRFERAYGGMGGGVDGIRIDMRQGDDYKPVVTPVDIPTEAQVVDLKIIRTGRVFSAYWREDEDSEWRSAGEVETDYADTIMAGVVACNTAREVTAEFSYIKLLPGVKR